MKEQEINNDSIAWVVHLKTTLEMHGYTIGPDQAVRLNKVFRHYHIDSLAAINRHKGLLIPLVARNRQEQTKLQEILDAYYPEDASSAPAHKAPGGVKGKVKTIKRILRWINKPRILPGLLLLLCVLGIVILYFAMNRNTSPGKVTGNLPKDTAAGKGAGSALPSQACPIIPSFTYRIDNTKGLGLVLKNTSIGPKKCQKILSWDFGDGTTRKTQNPDDSIVHYYETIGLFRIQLTIWGKDSIPAKASMDVHVGMAIDHDLPEVKPHKTFPQFVNAGIRMPLLICIALILIVLVWTLIHYGDRLYQYFIDRRIGKSLQMKASAGAGIHYSFKDQRHLLHKPQWYNKHAASIHRQPAGDTETIDIPHTIYQTVRNFGFPALHFMPVEDKKGLLILIDTGPATGQQADLFEWICAELMKAEQPFVRYYYRSSLQFISKEKNGEGRCTAESLVQQYKNYRLIIWGNGYELLQPFHTRKTTQALKSSGKEVHAAVIFRNWTSRILFTPVPRNCWSTYEKQLLQFIPLQPATWEGIQLGWKTLLLDSKYLLPANADQTEYPPYYPLAADISAYQAFFQHDVQLLTWLYALAIPDRLDFHLTLAIGHALESNLFSDNRPLVTYDNVLRLTAVEFLQTGILSTAHKTHLIEALKGLPAGQEAIRMTAQAALDLYNEVEVTNGSVLAMEKRINELILTQWASAGAEYETGFLHKHHLLDNFHEKAFGNIIRKLQHSWIKRHGRLVAISSVAGLVIGSTLLSQSLLINNYLEARIPKAWIIDNFSRYINEACDSMNNEVVHLATPGQYSYKTFNEGKTRELLAKAANISDTSQAYIYNINVADYKTAKSLYDRRRYKEALQKFNGILSRDIEIIDAADDSVKIFAAVGQLKCYYFLGDTDYFFDAASRFRMSSELYKHDFHFNYDSLIIFSRKP